VIVLVYTVLPTTINVFIKTHGFGDPTRHYFKYNTHNWYCIY